jgi:imidazolonepropionase-like amidohydrolase
MAEALQTATREPADFLGRLRSSGTIEQGKFAELGLLVDGHPLVDIRNARHVAGVIRRGRVITPAALIPFAVSEEL